MDTRNSPPSSPVGKWSSVVFELESQPMVFYSCVGLLAVRRFDLLAAGSLESIDRVWRASNSAGGGALI